MKRLTTVLSSLAIAALGGFFFASCTNPSSPGTTVGAPTNLMALSKDANTISIKWTRGSGDTAAEKVVLSSNTVTDTLLEPSSVTQLDLNVSEGVLYTMVVVSSGGSSNSVTWMTATRTMGLTIWETRGTGASQPSALQLSGADGFAHAISSNDASNVDFVLHSFGTDTVPSGLSFETAEAFDQTYAHLNYINGAPYYIPGGLDANYRSTAYPDTATSAAYDIPNDATYGTTGSRVLIVETSDHHLALVEIVPQSNGQLYGTSGTAKFITVNVSYQTAGSEPYAARPHVLRPWNGDRNPAH